VSDDMTALEKNYLASLAGTLRPVSPKDMTCAVCVHQSLGADEYPCKPCIRQSGAIPIYWKQAGN